MDCRGVFYLSLRMTSTQPNALPVMKNSLKKTISKKVENNLIKTVYVDDTNRVTIICPTCRTEKNMDVAYFKDTHKRMKVKCPCGESFQFPSEFRRTYRENFRLGGEYFVQGKDGNPPAKFSDKFRVL
jgi:hypothetical protein